MSLAAELYNQDQENYEKSIRIAKNEKLHQCLNFKLSGILPSGRIDQISAQWLNDMCIYLCHIYRSMQLHG